MFFESFNPSSSAQLLCITASTLHPAKAGTYCSDGVFST